MPKFACNCGYIIDLVPTPAPEEFLLVPESAIEQVSELLESRKTLDREMFYELIDRNAIRVIRCPNCGRIHVQREKGAKEFVSFVREDKAKELPKQL
jgi:hypothetical protein